MQSKIKSFRDLIVWQKAKELAINETARLLDGILARTQNSPSGSFSRNTALALCITFISVFYVLSSVFSISPANAGSASLSLVSSKRTYKVGESFNVSVTVSTGDVSINAASATITFDQSKLSVISVARSGSVFTLWAEEPTFSNNQGVVSFGGGLPTPGFSGRGAAIIHIAFRAKTVGATAVRFANGTVLANDGKGTNVLAGLGSLELTIEAAGKAPPPEKPALAEPSRPAPVTPSGQVPSAPLIFSRTHPDESRWYKNSVPGIIWELPTDANGVNVSIDQNITSDPGPASLGLFNFYTVKESLKDGVWYAHVRIKNSRGWGATGHYRLSIDTTPPAVTSAKIVVEGAGRRAVEFATSDSLSSTERVAIMVNGEGIATNASSPYVLPSLPPGDHTISIVAFDKANNSRTQELYLSILPPEPAPPTTGGLLSTILALFLLLILIITFIIWYIHERHHRREMMVELSRTRRELKNVLQKLHSLEQKFSNSSSGTIAEKSATETTSNDERSS